MSTWPALVIAALAGALIGMTLIAPASADPPEPDIEAQAIAACLNGGGFAVDGVLYLCMPAGHFAWRRP